MERTVPIARPRAAKSVRTGSASCRELVRRLAPNALGSMTSVLRSTRYPDRF